MFASLNGHFNVVKYLVSKGANVNARNIHGVKILFVELKILKSFFRPVFNHSFLAKSEVKKSYR